MLQIRPVRHLCMISRAMMDAYKPKLIPRSSESPSVSVSQIHQERFVYVSFFFFAPLTFAVPRRVFCLFLRCLPVIRQVSIFLIYSHILPPWKIGLTYAVVCWASQSSMQHQHEPICSGARTSSTPLGNRRQERNQLSSHHRTEFADRRH